jgi:PKD repeat protein
VAGNFKPTVNVSDSFGLYDNASSSIIVIGPPVISSVLVTPNPVDLGSPVTINVRATGGSPPYTYIYQDLPPGCITSNTSNYQCIPTAAGNFSVNVGVNTHIGTGTFEFVYLNVSTYFARILFQTPIGGYGPLSVTMAANITGGASPYNYSWNFGDGSGGYGEIVSHTYQIPSGCGSGGSCTRNVTLTARDSAGHLTYASGEVSVWPAGTKTFSTITSLTPSAGTAPLHVTFSATASGGTAPYTYVWAFGDGANGVGPSAQHNYTTIGTYTVILTAVDANGLTAIASSVVVVNPPPSIGQTGSLELSINVGPANGPAPLDVQFTGSAQGGKSPYSFSWNFGDGNSTAIGISAAHVYNDPGVYVGTLFVVDSAGNEASSGAFVTVYQNGTSNSENALAVSVAALSLHGSAPFTITLNPAIHGGTAPYRLVWNFGDGSQSVITSNSGTITHSYASAGNYYPQLQVTDSAGTVKNWSSAPAGIDHPVTVTPGSGGGTSLSSSLSWIYVAIAVLVIAVVLVVLIMRRRKRGTSVEKKGDSGKQESEKGTP